VTGRRGCLGRLVLLVLITWPIGELAKVFGWSDAATGSFFQCVDYSAISELGDLAFLLSNSGQSEEIVRLVACFTRLGVRPRVAIINQTMARYYFGNASPIGRHVIFDGDDQPYEIVGVVGDAKYMEIREATWRTIYLNTFQESWVGSNFVLRTSIAAASVESDVRRTVRDLLKTVPVTRVTTLADQVDASIVPERLIALLSSPVKYGPYTLQKSLILRERYAYLSHRYDPPPETAPESDDQAPAPAFPKGNG